LPASTTCLDAAALLTHKNNELLYRNLWGYLSVSH
jgi:hypothetical protein